MPSHLALLKIRGWVFHLDLFWEAHQGKHGSIIYKTIPWQDAGMVRYWLLPVLCPTLPNLGWVHKIPPNSSWVYPLTGVPSGEKRRQDMQSPALAALGSADWLSSSLTAHNSCLASILMTVSPFTGGPPCPCPFGLTRNTSHLFPSGTLDSKVSFCMLPIKCLFI